MGIKINQFRQSGRISNNIFSAEYEKSGPFKHVATMALKVFKVPVALVVFEDENNGLKSGVASKGIGEMSESKGESLNSLAIIKDEIEFLEDAGEEVFELSNSLVAKGLGWHFSASAPLIATDSSSVGGIYILDRTAREFNEADQQMLKSIAAAVIYELGFKR